jgi:uncharacterized protein
LLIHSNTQFFYIKIGKILSSYFAYWGFSQPVIFVCNKSNQFVKESIMEAQINPVNWFEIPVENMDRAKEFYEYVFNCELALNEMGPALMAWFPMVQDGPGATGSLIKADGYTPSVAGSLVYFSVEDIDATLKRVEEKGGKTLNPKMSIGEHGFFGNFVDSEGNRVALHTAS